MKELNFITPCLETELKFTDWEIDVIDYLEEHPNIKKVWLVNYVRKTGATYFSKMLLYFRKPCDATFVISNHIDWSKHINRDMPISFYTIYSKDTSKNKIFTASNFMTPVTLSKIDKKIDDDKKVKSFLEDLDGNSSSCNYECLYDHEFNIEKYKTLCTYNFKFFIINVSPKDLEKARPFIEADKDKEDVLIVEIKESFIK